MKLSDEASFRLGNCKELPDSDEAFIVSGIQALEAALKQAQEELEDYKAEREGTKEFIQELRIQRDALIVHIETLLSHPSDNDWDAQDTDDGYTLTPLQIAERNARKYIKQIEGGEG